MTYYVTGGSGGTGSIASWVKKNVTQETAGGQAVYDLTDPKG